jgi:DNA-binding response OmpR family regulator
MGRKILIVDDEPQLLALLGEAFRKSGMEVYLARNGDVALELYNSVYPDLVITDIVMPAKEGVALIIDIKKSLFHTPIIAMSGGGIRGCRDYLRWAAEFGADLVLQKPFRTSTLLLMASVLMDKLSAPSEQQHSPAAALAASQGFADLFDDVG